MNFELSEEQQLVADSIARFVQDNYDLESRMAASRASGGFSADHWKTMAELGYYLTYNNYSPNADISNNFKGFDRISHHLPQPSPSSQQDRVMARVPLETRFETHRRRGRFIIRDAHRDHVPDEELRIVPLLCREMRERGRHV